MAEVGSYRMSVSVWLLGTARLGMLKWFSQDINAKSSTGVATGSFEEGFQFIGLSESEDVSDETLCDACFFSSPARSEGHL